MAVSVRSRSAVGIAALAATALVLPAVTPSTPVTTAAHTVTITSDAPARQFAVQLLSSLEQMPAAAAAAKGAPAGAVAAAAVPAASVLGIFPAVGYGIATTYMAGLTLVNNVLAGAYGLVSAIPLVNVLAPQIYLLTNPIKQVISSAVLNTALTIALKRDPFTAVFNVISSVVSAAVSFVVNEVGWALNAPAHLLGLAAMPAAASAKSAAAAPAAAAAVAPAATTADATDTSKPDATRKARADKRHQAKAPAAAVSAAADTTDQGATENKSAKRSDNTPTATTDQANDGGNKGNHRQGRGHGNRGAGKHARA